VCLQETQCSIDTESKLKNWTRVGGKKISRKKWFDWCLYSTQSINVILLAIIYKLTVWGGSSRGIDRMVVGFTITYAISAYHHWWYECDQGKVYNIMLSCAYKKHNVLLILNQNWKTEREWGERKYLERNHNYIYKYDNTIQSNLPIRSPLLSSHLY
jgi:hypothetical protein